MAKTTITMRCGHTEVHNITGPYAGRGREADRIARCNCEPCAIARLAAVNAASALSNAATGLPTLIGSPKQVAWAESIRQPLSAITPELTRALGARVGATSEEIEGAVSRVEGWLEQTRAAWWIDNRTMIATAVRRYQADSAREYLDAAIPVLMGSPE